MNSILAGGDTDQPSGPSKGRIVGYILAAAMVVGAGGTALYIKAHPKEPPNDPKVDVMAGNMAACLDSAKANHGIGKAGDVVCRPDATGKSFEYTASSVPGAQGMLIVSVPNDKTKETLFDEYAQGGGVHGKVSPSGTASAVGKDPLPRQYGKLVTAINAVRGLLSKSPGVA